MTAHQHSILIIEEHRASAEGLRHFLESRGYSVLVAHRGLAGIGIAREMLPALVLCDVALHSGLDGCDVARALKRDPATRGIRLIALTSHGSRQTVPACIEAGFDDILLKPVPVNRLLEAVQALEPNQPGQPQRACE